MVQAAAVEQVASASLMPQAWAKYAFAAPGWLAWLPLVAFALIGGGLVVINLIIASDPLRVAGLEAEEASRRGEHVNVEPSDINGYPLPYISDAASPEPEFTFWRVGLGLGSILFVLLYLALLPIYPATVQALDKLPTTADGLGWARSGWRIACALTTVSFLLLLVVANVRGWQPIGNDRVHIPGQDVAHRLCFGISFIILACAAQPLLTACGRRLHRAAPDGPGAWLTALRAALCLVLFVSGWVMTYIFLRLGDYSTVEYICVGNVIAFQLTIGFETRAVLRWLAEQRALDTDLKGSPGSAGEGARAERSKGERTPLVVK